MKFFSGALVALSFAGQCWAQGWPSAPLRYIVPFPPGGSTDVISRHLGEKLRERLGQPVVIENIGGAGSAIGVGRVAKAAPDGYTIGLGNTASHTIIPYLSASAPYDPIADFSPITIITSMPMIKAGTLRALATTGRTRDPFLPDVPAVAEFYRGYEVAGFMAVFGPAGMPRAVVDRLNTELVAIIRSPEMMERLSLLCFNPRTSTPEELALRVRKDGAHWKALITSAGIKLD